MNFALLRYVNCLAALGQTLVVCLVLLGSLCFQFFDGELPCPLCVLQRLAFLLACVGPILILRQTGEITYVQAARGHALTIFASLLGGMIAVRQILLHIVPPDPGYGPPFLGLHLYTWALIVFVCLIASSAVALVMAPTNGTALPSSVTKPVAVTALALAVIVALATLAMQGPHLLLPDDPEHYELFRVFRNR